jgi:hypothetical protein
VWAAIAINAAVDLRPVVAQDAFLIISQFSFPANLLVGKRNCRSLGFARDDKGEDGSYLSSY